MRQSERPNRMSNPYQANLAAQKDIQKCRLCALLPLPQEWASRNQVVVPQKEGRVNASQLYKGGDEDAPTNILQVGCCSCGTAHTRLW